MNILHLQREGPRLVAMHRHLIQPAMWKKAQAERRFKRRHTFTLEADQRYVAELCIEKTCVVCDCSRSAIMCKHRLKVFTDPRHVAMTVAYEMSGLSSIVLGVKFNRDHTMILYAQERVNNDKTLRAQADKVVRAVKRELQRK